jgi:hypothetical protein
MRFKAGFLVGLGAGYVLGAKAGQERYQQIVQAARSFGDNPGVQRLTGEVNKTVSLGKDRVGEAAKSTVSQASDKAAEQVGKVKEAAGGQSSDREETTAGTPPATATKPRSTTSTTSTTKT